MADEDVDTPTPDAPSNDCDASDGGPSGGVRPWAGACGCGSSQLVYFVGELGFNFGRVTRLDSFEQAMGKSPHDPAAVLDYLDSHPWASPDVIWTLGYESIPIYAVAPFAYEKSGYTHLRKLMRKQLAGEVARVSIPGTLGGRVGLLYGHDVPVIVPDLRGITEWESSKLVVKGGDASKERERINFLDRVLYELRSPGLNPDDRAMNFVATQAHTTHMIFTEVCEEDLALEKITVDDSPICRPGSICRDVMLTFFDPAHRFEKARKVYRITVDVADTVPAMIGQVRSWHIY